MSTNNEASLQDLTHHLESEARYRRLVMRMPALVFELAPDGTLLFVNDAVTPMMGYRADEMEGRNWWGLVVPDDERSAVQDLLGRFQLGDVTGHELMLKAKDGSPVWLELNSANRYGADGTLQGIVGLGIDRTRRKRIEQDKNIALRDLGERVKEFAVLRRASYLLQDHARPIGELLQELLESLPLAYQFPEITAVRIVLGDEVFATPNYAASPWMLWADLDQHGIVEVCYLDERPVEAEGPFLVQERAFLDTLAEMLQAHLERRQVEQERTASEMRFRTLAESTSAAIFIVEGLRILYANDAARGITGYTRDELLNIELWQLAHPIYQTSLRQNGLQHPWGEAIHSRFELRVLTKGGEDRWWDVTAGSIEYDGTPAFVVTAFDITERDRAEKELHNAKQELEARVAERTAELRETAEHLQAANSELRAQAKELEAERRRYKELFDFAPGGYLVTDLHGTIRQANRAAAKILNVRADWLIAKSLTVYVKEQEHSAFYARLAELQEAQAPQTWEMWLLARDGESFPALVDVAPARDAQGQLVGLHWLLRDIAERKRAEEQLRYQAALLADVNDAIIASDAQYRLTAWNAAAEALYGWKAEEVLGRNGLEIMRTEWPVADAVEMRRIIAETGRWRGEAIQARQDGTRVPVEVSSMVLRDEDGRIAGYVSVNRDISERRRAEDALRESEQRFRLALKHAPVSVAAQDRDLRFLWAYNQRTVDPATVIGKTDMDLFPPEDAAQLVALKRKVLETETETREQFWMTSGGKRVYIDLYLEPMRDTAGQVTGIGIATVDLTQMKLVEDALRESKERYRTLFNEMTEGFAVHEIVCDERGEPCDYRFLDVNPSFERLTGLPRDQVVGKAVSEVLPNNEPHWVKTYGQVALTGQPVHFDSHAAALDRHYEVFAYCPGPRQFAVLFMDITERKQIEEQRAQLLAQVEQERNRAEALARALQAERDLLQIVMENTRTHLAYLDPQFNFVLVNAAYAQGSGHTKAELVGRNHFDLFPHQENRAIFQRVVDMGQPVEFHAKPFEFADQPWRGVTYWDWALVPVKDVAGRVQGLVFSLLDVTEQVSARKQIEQLAARDEAILNSMTEGLLVSDLEGNVLSLNPAARRIHGHAEIEDVDKPYEQVALAFDLCGLDGRPMPLDEWPLPRVLRGESIENLEILVRRPETGEVKVVDYGGTLVRDKTGQPILAIVTSRDITGQKDAQEALRRAHDELEQRVQERTQELAQANDALRRANAYNRSLIEASLDPLVTIGPDGKITDVNRGTELVTGCSRAELVGTDFSDYFTEPDKARAGYQEVFRTGSVRDYALELRHRDGRVTSVLYNATVYRDQAGRVTGVFAAARDITERKRAEEELRLRSAALEAAANGIIITDPQGNIQWSNPAFSRMTGYDSHEVLGQNTRFLKSGQHASEFYRHLWETILSGQVWRGEIVDRRKDASLYVEEMTIAPVLNEPGEITHFVAVKQDVTERKRAEAQLEQNNRELRALSEAERKARQIAETLAAANLALTRTLDLDAVMETLLDHVGTLVPYDSGNIMLLETESQLAVRVVRGYERWTDPQQVRAITFDAQTSPIFRTLLDAHKSVLIPDARTCPDWKTVPGTEHVRNWLGVPLVAGGHVIGVYSLDKVEPDFFTEEHVRLAEALVGQAAVAIQNAWLFTQVRAGRERLQSLSRRLVEVQEAERHYVARELHDEAGQALTSLLFGLGHLEQELDSPQQVTQVAELKEVTNEVLESLHRLAMDLRPASLDHLGLEPALNQYVNAIGGRYGLIAQFKAVGLLGKRLPAAMETALYRIVQEALTNAARHAHATRVDVLLERRGNQMVIVIEDNGVGFEADLARLAQSGHLGLVGMQERAEMLGGSLVIESTAGAGTTIVVEVPYAD